MPTRVVMLVHRKPGISPAAFKEHYERKHIPLVQALGGSKFTFSHKRHYIQRLETPGASDYPAAILSGSPEDFAYDCITEFTFENKDDLDAFFQFLAQEDIAKAIQADNEQFMDLNKVPMVMVDDVIETKFPFQKN